MLRQPASPVVNFTHMPSKYDFGSGDPDGAGEGAEFPAIASKYEVGAEDAAGVGDGEAAAFPDFPSKNEAATSLEGAPLEALAIASI